MVCLHHPVRSFKGGFAISSWCRVHPCYVEIVKRNFFPVGIWFRFVQSQLTWAEVRAMLGSNPSTDPRTRPKPGHARVPGFFSSPKLRDGTKAINPLKNSPVP